MIGPTPDSIREALIENVPILIGRANAQGLVQEIEGSVPREAALGPFIPGRSNLLDLLPEDADEGRIIFADTSASASVSPSPEKPPTPTMAASAWKACPMSPPDFIANFH